ncbi:MAG: hypothetical protein V3T77_05225 [Planctomycetota bacterium]
MKRGVLTILLLVLVAVAGYSLGSMTTSTATAQNKKKGVWQDIAIGEIPTNYGDLVAFGGAPNNWGLVFKNNEGELRIIEFRGGKLPNRSYIIKRSY